jgi:hypothetical protein
MNQRQTTARGSTSTGATWPPLPAHVPAARVDRLGWRTAIPLKMLEDAEHG